MGDPYSAATSLSLAKHSTSKVSADSIARYFLHMKLPDVVGIKVEERLLPSCLLNEEEDLGSE
jgi:hypothetical protein